MVKFQFGLTSKISSDLGLMDATFTGLGDTYITPFPQLWGSSGFHLSIHRNGHVHLKSERVGIHEDVKDFQSLIRLARTPHLGSFKTPRGGQPANILVLPFDPFRYVGITTKRKMMLNVDALSRSAIEISLADNAHLPYRMDSLRNMGLARAGDIALIHCPESNEISTYVFPLGVSKKHVKSPFFTFKSDFLNGSPENIMNELPFIKPLYRPMIQAMNKMSSSGYINQITSFPALNPTRRFALR